MNASLNYWQSSFEDYLDRHVSQEDASHDIDHFRRVWNNAKAIAVGTNANMLVVLAACYFHDIISLPKDHPDKWQCSGLAANEAKKILKTHFPSFPKKWLDDIGHAIQTHSFSAALTPHTIEAKIVQDADRLDALGAIGIARVFYTGGKLNQQLYHSNDPRANNRPLNDRRFTLDHFKLKLFQIEKTMNTKRGLLLAKEKSDYLKAFVSRLADEIDGNPHSSEKTST